MEQNEKKSGMEKKASIIWTITWLAVVLQAVATAIMMKYLPDALPMHFDGAGNVDRYGEKYELYFLLGLTVFVAVMAKASTKTAEEDLRKSEDERKRNTAATRLFVTALAGLVLTLTMTGAEISLAMNGLGHQGEVVNDVRFSEIFLMITNVILGLFLVLLGNVMPKTSANRVFGVRTSWSSYNDETWSRTNRIGGKVCVVTGILTMIVALFVNYRYSMYISLVLVLFMVVALVIVSYKVYQDVVGSEETEEREQKSE